MRLAGKSALVTGGGRGIGRAIALRLAGDGADVAVLDIIGENAENVAGEIEAIGRRALAIVADLTCSAQVNAAIAKVEQEFGGIDILVNNAGVTQNVSVVDMTDEDWERIVNVNLRGTFYCCRAVLPGMMRRAYGRIVSISSVSAKQGSGVWGAAHYAAAKAGVIGFTKALAREVAQYNITVNAIAPGVIQIPIADERRRKAKEEAAARCPMRRQGRPEEVAAAVAFLASDDATYITGEIMDVNGGLYMD